MLTKEVFTQVLTEEGYPAELIESIWEARPPYAEEMFDADVVRATANLQRDLANEASGVGHGDPLADDLVGFIEVDPNALT